MKTKREVEEDFYLTCAEILGASTTYKDATPFPRWDRETGQMYIPGTRATRWGGREPGNGRFPGFGIIRLFGPTNIQVCLTNPISVQRYFTSMDAVLIFLRKISDEHNCEKIEEQDGKSSEGKD
jgi:hypothetical protein